MYYQNQAPTGSSYEYTNESAQGKNLLITLSAGDGSITNAQWVESNWTKYWSTGARGVSAKAFIGEVLHEVAQGGLGNPQTIADQKIHTGYESYRCGRYWYGKPKYCSRATYGWSNNIRAKTRAGSGEVKSFVLNLEPNATLRIVFEGNANITNTLFNGSVSITEVPFTPLPPLVTPPAQEESPQESAPNDTDSQDSTQGQTDQSEQAAPSPYTQVQLNAMRDIKTLFENASKNYATSPTITCYSLADGRAIPFVHYMRNVAGLFHIRTLEELSEELLNSLSFNNSSQCFNPVEKDTLPYPMEITQAINDLIDLDYQNGVFSMNYKEILAALGEQEGTIKIGG